MDFILGIAIGALSSYWVLLGLFLVAVITEYNKASISAAWFTTMSVVVAYITFGLSIPLWAFIPAYFVVGILWSFWRWKRHTSTCVELAIEGDLIEFKGNWTEYGSPTKKQQREQQRDNLAKHTDLKNNVGKVIAWVFAFPVSMLVESISDTISLVKGLILGKLASVYNRFSDSAMSRFDKEVK